MNRNLEDEQQKQHQTASNNILFPTLQFPQGGNQPIKSAFRLYKRRSEQEESLKDLQIDSKKETTISLTDSVTYSLNNYVYIDFNHFVNSYSEVRNMTSSTPNSFSTVLTEQPSPKSLKYQQLKILNHQEARINSKLSAKDKSTSTLAERKCCKCKKSRCLLLYCECFRAGQICQGCNCLNCMNTQEFGKQRIEAINRCLETNPAAFAPEEQIKAMKGCRCKKSGCKKGYCQCFQQGKSCSEACSCTSCENHINHFNDHSHKPMPSKKPSIEENLVS